MHATYPSVFGLTLGDPAFDAVTLAATYEEQKIAGPQEFRVFAGGAHTARLADI